MQIENWKLRIIDIFHYFFFLAECLKSLILKIAAVYFPLATLIILVIINLFFPQFSAFIKWYAYSIKCVFTGMLLKNLDEPKPPKYRFLQYRIQLKKS